MSWTLFFAQSGFSLAFLDSTAAIVKQTIRSPKIGTNLYPTHLILFEGRLMTILL